MKLVLLVAPLISVCFSAAAFASYDKKSAGERSAAPGPEGASSLKTSAFSISSPAPAENAKAVERKSGEAGKPFDSAGEKKWSAQGGSFYSRGAHYLAKGAWSNSLKISYNFLESSSFFIEAAYITPLAPVSEPSYYGLTDISLGGRMNFANRIRRDLTSGLAVSLPASKRARKTKRFAAFHGFLSYHKSRKTLKFNFRHVFYYGLHGARSDKSGRNPNPLISTAHSAALSFPYKKILFSASGRVYLYAYQADVDSDPLTEEIQLKLKLNYGGDVRAAFQITKNWSVFGRVNLNIPLVSPVLSGDFPLTRSKNRDYSLGAVLKL